MRVMELSEKELHCVARLLQSAIYSDGLFRGCRFCKYRCAKEKDLAPHFDILRQKLYEMTGVDLRIGSSTKDWLPYSQFPYKKFLRAANDDAIRYFRDAFADI